MIIVKITIMLILATVLTYYIDKIFLIHIANDEDKMIDWASGNKRPKHLIVADLILGILILLDVIMVFLSVIYLLFLR